MLNLSVYRVEASQRDGKAPIDENAGGTSFSSNAPHKPEPKNPRTEPPLRSGQPFCPEQPPHGPYRAEEDAYDDTHFHPRVRLEFPTFEDKEDPLPWLNRCETFFRGQGTPEPRRVWYAAMHLTGVGSSSPSVCQRGAASPTSCSNASGRR